jgi:glucan phosphoethanolaminetransferase (alkaline phosphatase superfamily)|tara:strand:+ start:314 stop:619 length:306 start_codon:yes stop_codon:yes gene_type:complete
MATEENIFRTKTIDGVKTYFYNGQEVSEEEFDKQRAASTKSMEEKLGMTIEEKRQQMKEKVAAAKAKAAENKLAKGGMVNKKKKKKLAGRLAMRGYGVARK